MLQGRYFAPWLLTSFLCISTTVFADWQNELDFTVTHDDNIGLSPFSYDQQSELTLRVQLGRGYFHHLSSNSAVRLRGYLDTEHYLGLSALDRLSVGLSAAWLWQHSAAFTSPVIEALIGAQGDRYDADQRDGMQWLARLSVTRRFTDRITASVGGEARGIKSSDFIDRTQSRVFINLDYAWHGLFAVYLTGHYLRGDVLTTVQSVSCDNQPVYGGSNSNQMNFPYGWVRDAAFEKHLCGEWISYRQKMPVKAGTLGINVALHNTLSLDFAVTGAQSSYTNDGKYERLLSRASILWHF